MRRLVIALPYYEKDRPAAMRLAKFICALEPKFRDDVELCFVSRFDSMPITPGEMIQYVTTFKVSWFHTSTKVEGHPAACNAMAREFFVEAIERVNTGDWANVDAILFMEPDCVPVAQDWIDQLRAEWDRANEAARGILVVGCFRTENVDVPHVNGNAMWFPKLADYADLYDVPGLGWDSAISTKMPVKAIFPTPLISNLWMETKVSDGRLAVNPFHADKSRAPVLIHGVKDESAWDYAKRRLNL